MSRVIEVVDYCPEWEQAFLREADALRRQLATVIVACHHIGSTAVPHLAAKPVIDIVLEVADLSALALHDDALRTVGYASMGEYGIPGRRFYHKGGDMRTHHVHAFEAGSPHVERHLCVRDFLRSHPEAAAEYGALKMRLAAQFGNEPERYVEAKSAHVRQLEEAALRWRRASQPEAERGRRGPQH